MIVLSRLPFILIAALFLAACLTTPPSTVAKLARLSPLEADPSAIRLAVRLPGSLVVRDGDVRLRVSFDGGSEATRLVEEYAAVIADGAEDLTGIATKPGDGSRVFVAALTEDDAASLADTQRRIRAWRAAGIEGKGQLAVMATACANGPFPDGPIPLTTWMRTSPDEPFFVLARTVDLRRQFDSANLPYDAIERCPPRS